MPSEWAIILVLSPFHDEGLISTGVASLGSGFHAPKLAILPSPQTSDSWLDLSSIFLFLRELNGTILYGSILVR